MPTKRRGASESDEYGTNSTEVLKPGTWLNGELQAPPEPGQP